MDQVHVARLGAAAVAELLPSGVLLVRFVGVITGRSLPELKRPIAERLGADALAVAADYTSAILALGDADLQEMMGGHDPDNLPGLPAAVACNSGCAVALKRHALDSVIAHARDRIVVTELPVALAWAGRMAGRRRPRYPAAATGH